MPVRWTKKSVVSCGRPVGEDAMVPPPWFVAHRAHGRRGRTVISGPGEAQKLRPVEPSALRRRRHEPLLHPVRNPVGQRLEHREALGVGSCSAEASPHGPPPREGHFDVRTPRPWQPVSTPDIAASTMVSATEAPCFAARGLEHREDRGHTLGPLPSTPSGASLMRAPLARRAGPTGGRCAPNPTPSPPMSATESPEAADIGLERADIVEVEPAGIGSCQIRSSAGASGPISGSGGRGRGWSSLNQARRSNREIGRIGHEFLTDRVIARVHLHRHVVVGHHRHDTLGRIGGIARHVLFADIDRPPLPCARGRFGQFHS